MHLLQHRTIPVNSSTACTVAGPGKVGEGLRVPVECSLGLPPGWPPSPGGFGRPGARPGDRLDSLLFLQGSARSAAPTAPRAGTAAELRGHPRPPSRGGVPSLAGARAAAEARVWVGDAAAGTPGRAEGPARPRDVRIADGAPGWGWGSQSAPRAAAPLWAAHACGDPAPPPPDPGPAPPPGRPHGDALGGVSPPRRAGDAADTRPEASTCARTR